MQEVPLAALPAQKLSVTLGDQIVGISVYQKFYGLFIDVYVGGTLVIGGVICQNLNRIVRDAYFGFVGDLCFIDTQGTDDPDYTGLGTRFLLAYLDAADLEQVPA